MKRLGLLAVLAVAVVSIGWNPLFPPDTFRFSAGSFPIIWNPDGGPLGMLSNAEAIILVDEAFDVWEAVPTSNISFTQGPQIVNTNAIPVDVTSANFDEIRLLQNGQNPVIFDNDRDIFDALGVPSTLVGFGTPVFANGLTIIKSMILIEGDWIDGEGPGTPPSDPGELDIDLIRAVVVHEDGHFSGLGHTTLNRGIDGINGCPAPSFEHRVTMNPTVSTGALTLHADDIAGISSLYPAPGFSTMPVISGHLISRDGVTPFDGGNVILRPDTMVCEDLYQLGQATQSGSNPFESGGPGSFEFPGLAMGVNYTVQATSLVDDGAYPIGGLSPPPLGGPDDFYNGLEEAFFDPPDDPTVATPVVAGTTGIELKINNASPPGQLLESGPDSLQMNKFDGMIGLPPLPVVLDDGTVTSAWGFSGTTQQAWVNRFTPDPSSFPFRIERVDLMFWHESALPGRPIRILVYADPTSSGNPANATLVYSEDTTIKFPLSFTEFQEHVLTTPVTITIGEFYVGVFDLVADEATNFIASYDENTQEGRAYLQVNATDPAGFGLCTGANPQCSTDRTWMVRAFGSTVPSAGELGVFWGEPCNSGVFPEQDFAVYRGTLASLRMGIFDHAPVTCSTRRGGSFRVTDGPPESQYWLVTPTQANLEGSLEPRTPTATCAEVGPDVCP